MIININETTYEFIRKFLIYNLVTHGYIMIQEQNEYIKKLLEKNKDMYIFNDGVHVIICREIEEAKYKEIKKELTNGESNDKV